MFSFALQSDGISFPSSGMPSSTHRGAVVPFRVTVLRIFTALPAPGAPVVGAEKTPASCPSSSWSTLATPICFTWLMSTVEMDEVSFRFSIFWYPVTTTASMLVSSGASRTVIVFCPVISTFRLS